MVKHIAKVMAQCSEFCIGKVVNKGFKFNPSKQQICEIYLKSKIEGKMLPCKHMIFDDNLYEDHSTPWEIFKSDDSRWLISSESSKNRTKKVIYVFTMLKKKGERVLRKAGCGTWTGQNKKEVMQGGNRIGFDSLLTFKIKDGKKMKDDRGNWTMHEYSLYPNDYNCAICKITKEEDASEKFVASSHNESMVYEEPSLHNYEYSTNSLDPQVPVYDFPYGNMFNQENPVQVQPLLDQEWGSQAEWSSYSEILNQILEPPQEKECCIYNNMEKQFPNVIHDALEMQEHPEEKMINKLAQPQKIEDYWTKNLHTYLVSDPFFKPPQYYEETKDMQVYCPLPNNNQVLVVEQEQRQQQGERIAFVSQNFDYNSYDQQKQQLEGGQNNSLEKRKNRSHHEEEFLQNKKHQPSSVSSLH